MSTERRNPRSVDIDLFPTERILRIINEEDALVAQVVSAAVPQVARVVDCAADVIRRGGRVIYVGAGTSGRIAALDAAECPSTFGTPPQWFQAVVAGGAKALAQAMEDAEDNVDRGAADLKSKRVTSKDLVIGIAASGKTPYTCSALRYGKSKGAKTVALVATTDSAMSRIVDLTIETIVGPEIVTGSTRMKAGTAQKMILNMISTATMIRLGMTYSNWMINVNMSNAKLRARGIQILGEILGLNPTEAEELSSRSDGKLKLAVVMGALGCSRPDAELRLRNGQENLRKILGYLGSGRE